MMRWLDELPTLGVGLGYRDPYRADLFARGDGVDFLEITADQFLPFRTETWQLLDLLRERFTLIPHAIRLSLGSAEGLDDDYLTDLAALVRHVDPPWWSEHIAFTKAGGRDAGHLTPLPFTNAAADALARNVDHVRRRIETPLILENITYPFALPGARMSEAAFVTRVVERTECGLLLDVANLHANAVNHGYDALGFLDAIPCERVVQLHVAGGHGDRGTLIDSHAHRTPREVWDLLDDVLARAPARGAIIERDENLPPFTEIVEEISHARAIGRLHGLWT